MNSGVAYMIPSEGKPFFAFPEINGTFLSAVLLRMQCIALAFASCIRA